MDYEEYLRAFNSVEDMAGLLEHYAPDARIEGANGLTSLDDFLVQLRDVRDGVRVTRRADHGARRREPDHGRAGHHLPRRARPPRPPVGPLRAGESVTMRFFSSYDLEDGQVARFSRAFWRT